MVITMKVGSSTYTALAGMQKGLDNMRKHTAELASATQMQGHVDPTKSLVDLKSDSLQLQSNAKASKSMNETLGTIIDVKA